MACFLIIAATTIACASAVQVEMSVMAEARIHTLESQLATLHAEKSVWEQERQKLMSQVQSQPLSALLDGAVDLERTKATDKGGETYTQHQAVTIDMKAWMHNVRANMGLVPKSWPVFLVLKADAYGHNLRKIAVATWQAATAEEKKRINFAIVDTWEGCAIRKAFSEADIAEKPKILRIRAATVDDMLAAKDCDMIELAGTTEQLDEIEEKWPANKKLEVQINMDTGMGRAGMYLTPGDDSVDKLAKKIGDSNKIQVTGIMTHLHVSADGMGDDKGSKMRVRTTEEIKSLLMVASELLNKTSLKADKFMVHYCNSAAVLDYMDLRPGDLEGNFKGDKDEELLKLHDALTSKGVTLAARPGTSLYGMVPAWGGKRTKEKIIFWPVMRWTATIAAVRKVPEGKNVGYGMATAPREMTVATLPIGYADGYPRPVPKPNFGGVLIAGKFAPFFGQMSMDMMTVDVTDFAAEVKTGDAAILLGVDGTPGCGNCGTNKECNEKLLANYCDASGGISCIPKKVTDGVVIGDADDPEYAPGGCLKIGSNFFNQITARTLGKHARSVSIDVTIKIGDHGRALDGTHWEYLPAASDHSLPYVGPDQSAGSGNVEVAIPSDIGSGGADAYKITKPDGKSAMASSAL